MNFFIESTAEKKMNIMIWIVALGFFMQTLDTTIVNTALPTMAHNFNIDPLKMQSVVFVYSLMMAAMIPASGWLADKFGTMKVYVAAICVFSLGSLLCAASWNLELLICSRIIQGLGGAMLMPVGRLAVLRNFPGDKFLPAISLITTAGLVGPLIGPTLGGLLSQFLSWRWIFLINLPAGVFGTIATIAYMPNNKLEQVGKFDIPGYCLLAFSMVISSLSIEALNDTSHGYSMTAILAFLGMLSIYAYIRYARRVRAPLFNLGVFKVSSFAVGISGNFFARLGNSAMPYLLPLFMQTHLGYTPVQSGMMLLPSTLAGMAAKTPAPFLIRRFGYRKILVTNTILVGIAMSSFTSVAQTAPTWHLVLLMAFFGAVNSFQFTAMNTLTLKDLPEREASTGNSVLSVVQMLALSVSVVIAGAMLNLFKNVLAISNLSFAFQSTFILVGVLTSLSAIIFNRA
jgi:EmrB/QacA subfamily drug resistance transporter